MLESIVPWAFLFLIIAAVIGVGWWRNFVSGENFEKKSQAERERDAVQELASKQLEPLRDDVSHYARLRKAAADRIRMRDRKTRPRDD